MVVHDAPGFGFQHPCWSTGAKRIVYNPSKNWPSTCVIPIIGAALRTGCFGDGEHMWWLVVAVIGTVAQIRGTYMNGRGMTPDSPWGDTGGQIQLPNQDEEKVREYGRRESYRIWGNTLTNSGTLLLLASAMLVPPEALRRWILAPVFFAVAASIFMAIRATRRNVAWVQMITHFIRHKR